MTITPPAAKWCEIKGECPACGHKGGWCTASADGLIIKCMRAISDRPIKQKDGSIAYLHSSAKTGKADKLKAKAQRARLTKSEIASILKSHKTAVNPQRLTKFATSLGVSVKALKAYGVGWDTERGAWSFPMYDGKRNIIGIHLRDGAGKKWCVPGSQLGLFIPGDYDPKPIPAEVSDDPMPWLLMLPEGLTDAMTAYDFGLMAVGRPSNKAGSGYAKELLHELPKQIVIVVADNDRTKYMPNGTPYWPGIEGAVELAEAILPEAGKAKFMLTPKPDKDLREWKNKGGDMARLLAELMAAPLINWAWIARARKRLAERVKTERRLPTV